MASTTPIQAPVPDVSRYLLLLSGPGKNTMPFGARWIIGNVYRFRTAVLRFRQVPVENWKTCGSWLFPAAGVIVPLTTRGSPLPSRQTEGYQRPAFMFVS